MVRRVGIKNKIGKLSYAMRHSIASPFFGFIQGHGALSQEQLDGIRRLVGVNSASVVCEFENRFAALVGSDTAISFAAGRMAFFALMKALTIGVGDEVVLPGATCAVMVNAVLRAGAIPVFADIDPETFGSSAHHIAPCISSKTRMIVAQHSFGIPCDIMPIVQLARDARVFLLEDCALSLGSTVNDTAIGNFGDAALFSTDHTKPINTLIGGLLVTRDSDLASKLRDIQSAACELPLEKQQALWKRLLFERELCMPARYGSYTMRDLAIRVGTPPSKRAFLDEDFGITAGRHYPYPAQMPAFLSAIGTIEIQNWSRTALERKALLQSMLNVVDQTQARAFIPKAYRDPCLDIVPLRLAWSQTNGAAMRTRFSGFVDVSWTWFMQPIVGVQSALEAYGYCPGSCAVSERVGPDMVNLPCNVFPGFTYQLVERVRDVLVRDQ